MTDTSRDTPDVIHLPPADPAFGSYCGGYPPLFYATGPARPCSIPWTDRGRRHRLHCRPRNGDRCHPHLPAHRNKRSTVAANTCTRDERRIQLDAKIQMYVGGSLALLGSRSVSPSIGSCSSW